MNFFQDFPSNRTNDRVSESGDNAALQENTEEKTIDENDLKLIEFNSADDVRQEVKKRVLEESEDLKDHDHEADKKCTCPKPTSSKTKRTNFWNLGLSIPGCSHGPRPRGRRPRCAVHGSGKISKASIERFYIGRLSNIMKSNNRR
ncbi:hypothetical protein JYU34_013738 [Plutella xylostella]|uniref:Uncharacterized protein n=2 Tax=Plutella xylostella TaxID=51655 RepID=A0ABQ7QAI3_PLUXY|nr:uncharacterized protein LOC105394043 [Plutella xylostella]KAG7302248.1 hypothetical protein JYU34_013738 [Plutella xylostella]CAG9123207.1 unnamed protein product [Plutella xylostella]